MRNNCIFRAIPAEAKSSRRYLYFLNKTCLKINAKCKSIVKDITKNANGYKNKTDNSGRNKVF
jgi:hypothetical protein